MFPPHLHSRASGSVNCLFFLFRLFNPIEIVRDTSASINDLKEIELAAGRVAMVAFAGFAAQAAKTGEGPYSNLVDYMDDPLLLLGGRA